MAEYPIPTGVISKTSSSGNVANASAVATLTAPVNGRNYVTGFIITAGGATAGALVVATLTGVIGGTQSFIIAAPTGATLGTSLVVVFDFPIPASADGTAVVLTLPALGAGNTNAAVVLTGYSV